MAKLVDIEQGVHLSVSTFSREFGSTRETVVKRVAAAGLKPSGKRGGYPVYRLRDLHKAVYQSTDDGGIDPDRLDPFQRKAHYQAEHEKLRLEVERGELVPRAEVEQELGRVCKVFAQACDTTPDRVERETGAPAMLIAAIERVMDGMREEVYRLLTENEMDDDALRSDVSGS